MSKRFSPARLAAKDDRKQFRRSTSQHIGETRAIATACATLLSRGILGRFKWLLRGR